MNRVFVFCLLLSLGAAAQSPITQANDGSAGYGYAFDLPAARGRFRPHLALSYNSRQNANGSAGVGWNLNLSYIEQGARASLNPDGSFRTQYWLVIDGVRRLLVVDPNASGSYRPDVDTGYTQVTPSGANWTLLDSVGNTWTFAKIGTGASATYPRWYLVSVVDVDGNTSLFDYDAETAVAGSSALLSGIRYNNFNGGLFATKIQLAYTADTNRQLEVVGATPVVHSSLLSSVQVFRNVSATTTSYALLRKYDLAYAVSSITGRSLLTKVTMKGTDGTTAIDSGVTFAYSAQSGGSWLSLGSSQVIGLSGGAPASLDATTCSNALFGTANGFNCLSNLPSSCITSDVAAVVDLDGDGVPDLVWTDQGTPGAAIKWQQSIGQVGQPGFWPVSTVLPAGSGSDPGWQGVITFSNPTGVTYSQGTAGSTNTTKLIDMNGDGLPDLVQIGGTCSSQQTAGLEIRFNRLNAGGGFSTPVCADLSLANGDVNPVMSRGSCSGYSCQPVSFMNTSKQTLIDLVDVTGDGIPDYVVATAGGSWRVYPGCLDSTGQHWSLASGLTYATGNTTRVPISGGNYALVDMNGDGLPDLVNTGSGSPVTWNVLFNSGYNSGFVNRPDSPSLPNWANNTPANGLAGPGVLQNVSGSGRPEFVFTAPTTQPMTYAANIGMALSILIEK